MVETQITIVSMPYKNSHLFQVIWVLFCAYAAVEQYVGAVVVEGQGRQVDRESLLLGHKNVSAPLPVKISEMYMIHSVSAPQIRNGQSLCFMWYVI